jgi:hypothetical protein
MRSSELRKIEAERAIEKEVFAQQRQASRRQRRVPPAPTNGGWDSERLRSEVEGEFARLGRVYREEKKR